MRGMLQHARVGRRRGCRLGVVAGADVRAEDDVSELLCNESVAALEQ